MLTNLSSDSRTIDLGRFERAKLTDASIALTNVEGSTIVETGIAQPWEATVWRFARPYDPVG